MEAEEAAIGIDPAVDGDYGDYDDDEDDDDSSWGEQLEEIRILTSSLVLFSCILHA